MNKINAHLVMIFNEILLIEEEALAKSDFSDISIKEMHTLERIGLSGKTRASDLAKALKLTQGTVSVTLQNLVDKGYILRERLESDRRVIALKLTKKGKLLYRLHHLFHMKMIEGTLEGMSEEEAEVLLRGLKNLCDFLEEVKKGT